MPLAMSPATYSDTMQRLRRYSVAALIVGMAAMGSVGPLIDHSSSVQSALDAYKVFMDATFTDELLKSCVLGISGGIVISIRLVLCICVIGCLDRRHGARCPACGRTVTGAGLLQMVNEQASVATARHGF